MKLGKIHLCLLLVFMSFSFGTKSEILFYGNCKNDLVDLLQANSIPFTHFTTIDQLVKRVKQGDAVIITAPHYPDQTVQLSPLYYKKFQQLDIRVYIEFAE